MKLSKLAILPLAAALLLASCTGGDVSGSSDISESAAVDDDY